MSRLLDFYRGTATDSERRSLATILGWSDDRFEEVHDFIQWLFPLPEPSQFNSRAPLLTAEDRTAFQNDPHLRAALERSFARFLAFLGLSFTEEGQVIDANNFATRVADTWAYPNHNWLRISRVLRSLHLLGLDDQAQAFFAWLNSAYRDGRFPITADTFGYWSEAVSSPRGKQGSR